MNVEQVKSIDEAMGLAIEHSYQVKGTTYPKPPVGAVIVDPNGRIVGAGGTEPAGGDHAEVVALRRAGGLAAGAIVVVTMEPCNHYGKTPPCVNALIEARVGTVVYAVADPNGIAGGGAGRLSAAGLQVRSGVLAEQVAAGPLREWLHKQRTGLPHVTWKYATSIDGRSAAADGSSQWISSEAARLDLHRRRAIADAILVGTGFAAGDRSGAARPVAARHLPIAAHAGRRTRRSVDHRRAGRNRIRFGASRFRQRCTTNDRRPRRAVLGWRTRS